MSVAIFTSKPSVVRAIVPFLRERWPQETLVFPQLMLRGYYELPLPRGLRWGDYPHLEDTTRLERYRLNDDAARRNDLKWAPLVFVSEPGQALAFHHDPVRYVQGVQQAHEVWAFLEPHPTLCWAAHVLHQKTMLQRSLNTLMYHDLSAATLARLWAAGANQTPAAYRAQVAQGEVRTYFDHNFALNSLAILGRTFRTPDQQQPWVSKYQVQALFAIAHTEQALTMVQWLHRFQEWPGTGHYPPKESLGSALSRHAILEQLTAHGWIKQEGQARPLRLTEQGHAALEKLHPRCADPDLPFRLAAWMKEGLPQARPAMDRYLRTFFGRQKRFLDTVPGV